MSFPSKILVHSVEQEDYVESIELIFRNETMYDHIILEVVLSPFENFLQQNVHTKSNFHQCARSLMHHDEDRKCTLLGKGENRMRDLSINVFGKGFARISSWNHVDLGKPIQFLIYYHEVHLTEAPSLSSPTFLLPSFSSLPSQAPTNSSLPNFMPKFESSAPTFRN